MKYYTPTIEEFHVGFEYELFEDFDTLPEKIWHKQVYGINGANAEQIDHVHASHLDKVRVKYLDRDDIVECGWSERNGYYVLYNKSASLNFNNDVSGINVVVFINHAVVFHGLIKNKSELNLVMKMLGIK